MTVSSELQKLFEKLNVPEEKQQIVLAYKDYLVNMTFDEIESFASSVIDKDWEKAFMLLVKKMTVEELMASISGVNSVLKILNLEGEEKKKAMREIVVTLFTAGLAMLKSVVG